MLQIQPELGQISHKAAISGGAAAIRAPQLAKMREKRITCITCDGRNCVGRCRFKKLN